MKTTQRFWRSRGTWAILALSAFGSASGVSGCSDPFTCADTRTCSPSPTGGAAGNGGLAGAGGTIGSDAGAGGAGPVEQGGAHSGGSGGLAPMDGAAGSGVGGDETAGATGGTGPTSHGGVSTGGASEGGASSGGVSGEASITIGTSSVPRAKYNTPYSFSLSATGGTGLVWSLTSGGLPAGVELSSQGVLSGLPSASGDFSFSVSVQNSEGKSATQAFVLTVSRSRWLAYLSNKGTSGGVIPYVNDLSLSSFREFDLSSVLGTGCSATQLFFSPDGNRLAFLGGVGASCTNAAFVVDVSGSSPGTPKRADGGLGAKSLFSFSPDSRWLAYQGAIITSTNGGVWTANLNMSDVSGASPAPPVTVVAEQRFGPGTTSVWSGPTNFTWTDNEYWASTVRYSGGSWQAAASISDQISGGSLVNGTNDGFVVAYAVADRTRVIDLSQPAAGANWITGCAVSFDHRLCLTRTVADTTGIDTAHLRSPGLSRVDSSSSILAFDNLAPVWANQSDTAAALSTTTSADALFIDARSVTPKLTGIVGTGGANYLKFADRDDWLAFGSPSQWLVSQLGANGVGAPRLASTSPSTDTVLTSTLLFAPNSRILVYGSKTSGSNNDNDLYFVDLTGTAPGTPRRITSGFSAGTAMLTPAWTADSSFMAFRANSALFVVNVLASNSSPEVIVGSVYSFALQP